MEYVTSPDGTRIAYERTGNGPPLVLVHGSLNDRNAWGLVRQAFAEKHTVFAIDRRGRGESSPPAEHKLERQFEDVVAVIDAAGEPVDLLGHSFGARCALGAAALVPERVKHLVLYEPPSAEVARLDLPELFETASASDAVEEFMKMVMDDDEQVALLKASPFWAYVTSFAGTMPSEGRALIEHGFEPSHYAHLKMPALFLVGSLTEERLGLVMRSLQPYMPHAEWHTFEGQGHGANMLAAKEFAETVLAFLAK